jgi:hypothetical protein
MFTIDTPEGIQSYDAFGGIVPQLFSLLIADDPQVPKDSYYAMHGEIEIMSSKKTTTNSFHSPERLILRTLRDEIYTVHGETEIMSVGKSTA